MWGAVDLKVGQQSYSGRVLDDYHVMFRLGRWESAI